MCGDRDLVIVGGRPGVGKTTMIEAAASEFAASGYRVRGAALAGKAERLIEAETHGLVKSSTIAKLATNESKFQRLSADLTAAQAVGKNTKSIERKLADCAAMRVQKNDVLFIDEGSMIGTRQFDMLMSRAAEVGAKIVVIGDEKQFSPIDSGAFYRGICEKFGATYVTEIRRHDGRSAAEKNWMTAASMKMADDDIVGGLQILNHNGRIKSIDGGHQATLDAVVKDALADRDAGIKNKKGEDASQFMMSFTRSDVAYLNSAFRAGLVERGIVGADGIEINGATFATGDRIAFSSPENGYMVRDIGTADQNLDWQAVADYDARRQADRRSFYDIERDRQSRLKEKDWNSHRAWRQRTKRAIDAIADRRGLVGRGLHAAADMYYDRRREGLKEHIAQRFETALDRARQADQAEKNRHQGVVNGSIGTILHASADRVIVKIDPFEAGQAARVVAFDPKARNPFGKWVEFTHGYAGTYHKSQGQTIDLTYAIGSTHQRSDAVLVGHTRYRIDHHTYLDKAEFKTFDDYAHSAGRLPDADLVADYAPAKTPASERVGFLMEQDRALQIRQAELRQAAKLAGKEPWELDEWKSLQQAKADKIATAKEVLNDWKGHRTAAGQANLSKHRLEKLAGTYRPVLSESERAAFARVEAFAKLNLDARKLWQEIAKTHPGAQSRQHPEFARYDAMRADRDEAAYRLTSENGGRDVHRSFAKDAGASWKSIEINAAKHQEREQELAIRQSPEGRAIAAYKEARLAAGRLYTEIAGVKPGQQHTDQTRAAARAHPRYAEYRDLADTRNKLALEIEANRERFGPALAVAKVDEKALAKDIEAARTNIRQDQVQARTAPTPAPQVKTAEPVAVAPTVTPAIAKTAEPIATTTAGLDQVKTAAVPTSAPKPTAESQKAEEPALSDENQKRIAIYEKMRSDRQPYVDSQRKAYLSDSKRFGAALDVDIKVKEIDQAARAEAGKYGNVSVSIAVQRMELAQIRGETALAARFNGILRQAVVEHRTTIRNEDLGYLPPARVQQRPTREQMAAMTKGKSQGNGTGY
jgi:nucleoside-triphosphatase THEP1